MMFCLPTIFSNSTMMSVETSVNAMNQLYLKIKFFSLSVMLFFKLKTNQNLLLLILVGVTLFSSCSTQKKISVSKGKNRSGNVDTAGDTRHEGKTLRHVEIGPELEEALAEEPVSEEVTQKVISTARTFIGTPYKYGGMTRSGMDCSGLLINSFRPVKVNLPRSSAAQSKIGTEVKMNELQPGDLVFFATGNKKKEITHVGLVTDVKSKNNVKFIHASSSLGVVETNLFAEYYQKRFRVARRVIE